MKIENLIILSMFVMFLMINPVNADVVNRVYNQSCFDNTTLRTYIDTNNSTNGTWINETRTFDQICPHGCTAFSCDADNTSMTMYLFLVMVSLFGVIFIVVKKFR